MTDPAKDKADIESEELLPCNGKSYCAGQPHNTKCPAFYRPAIAAKLRERDAELKKLADDYDMLPHVVIECHDIINALQSQLAAANSEVDRLRAQLAELKEYGNAKAAK